MPPFLSKIQEGRTWQDPQETLAIREPSIYDLRDEFLARCRAKNLSDRTMEWYEDRTLQLCDLWAADGAGLACELTLGHVEDALVALRRRGLAPQTVRGFAQVAKTLCRFGHRQGLIAEDIVRDLERDEDSGYRS